uniref:Uncharacterized protein n=1 Tax=viral metagenome TaxID=1070528 RepID=A0A6C0C751_9ZZZZ
MLLRIARTARYTRSFYSQTKKNETDLHHYPTIINTFREITRIEKEMVEMNDLLSKNIESLEKEIAEMNDSLSKIEDDLITLDQRLSIFEAKILRDTY